MIKSLFVGALALLAATFGLPHKPVAITSIPVAPVIEVLTVVNHVSSASTTVFAVFDGGNAQLAGTLTQSSGDCTKSEPVLKAPTPIILPSCGNGKGLLPRANIPQYADR